MTGIGGTSIGLTSQSRRRRAVAIWAQTWIYTCEIPTREKAGKPEPQKRVVQNGRLTRDALKVIATRDLTRGTWVGTRDCLPNPSARRDCPPQMPPLCTAKVSYKKALGLLELTSTHLQWTQDGKKAPTVRVPHAEAACQSVRVLHAAMPTFELAILCFQRCSVAKKALAKCDLSSD